MEVENKTIHTYADDMAKVVEGNEPGLIKRIIEDQEKNEAFNANVSPSSRRNKTFIIISFIFVVLAITLFSVFFIFNKKIFTVMVSPQYAPLVFTDQNYSFEISGLNKEKVTQNIVAETNNTKIQPGELEGIYFLENKNVIGFKRFNSFIESNLTTDQIKAVNDNFLTGIVNNKKTDPSLPVSKNLFFLLRINSFQDVFNNMRTWESKMLYDLHGFFGLDLNAETNYLFTKDFEDGFVLNKNARILYDQDGKIILMYVFIDDNFVIISNNEMTISEVMNRISSSKTAK